MTAAEEARADRNITVGTAALLTLRAGGSLAEVLEAKHVAGLLWDDAHRPAAEEAA